MSRYSSSELSIIHQHVFRKINSKDALVREEGLKEANNVFDKMQNIIICPPQHALNVDINRSGSVKMGEASITSQSKMNYNSNESLHKGIRLIEKYDTIQECLESSPSQKTAIKHETPRNP